MPVQLASGAFDSSSKPRASSHLTHEADVDLILSGAIRTSSSRSPTASMRQTSRPHHGATITATADSGILSHSRGGYSARRHEESHTTRPSHVAGSKARVWTCTLHGAKWACEWATPTVVTPSCRLRTLGAFTPCHGRRGSQQPQSSRTRPPEMPVPSIDPSGALPGVKFVKFMLTHRAIEQAPRRGAIGTRAGADVAADSSGEA